MAVVYIHRHTCTQALVSTCPALGTDDNHRAFCSSLEVTCSISLLPHLFPDTWGKIPAIDMIPGQGNPPTARPDATAKGPLYTT